ncbi:plasmid partitioning protein RepB [Falsigemmobacter intermedius]|uniref:Plasmid partitioning protein RepB n=1 Tax=Falsigemmobacter intermedius TaxID=1553448 RepID=A0A451GGG8_9RHOB|nr:plasmid partitioning protein RepB [Falsigemmobacter intermedius]RWY35688.1 plasmid partitioning protein RepB [Falsigemmobacter intermedius]
MARRNLFQPPPPPAPATEVPGAPRFPNTGAMSGMKSTLRDMSSNAVREIDPSLIDDDGPRDRLAFGPEAVAELAESIRQHGQQVPIMVRPLRDQPGRYQVVYGRRRLAALRVLNQPARAMVRTLDDTQAILAQGQENSQRLDPSFIEKAMFAAQLAESGHAQNIILDALAIDRPMLSRMQKVARSLPMSLIEAIGPAHGVGRRRWEDLADSVRENGIDFGKLIKDLDAAAAGLSSDERFEQAVQAIARIGAGATRPAPREALRQITSERGHPLAELKAGARSLTVKIDSRQNPDFAAWFEANAEEELQALYRRWSETRQ